MRPHLAAQVEAFLSCQGPNMTGPDVRDCLDSFEMKLGPPERGHGN